MERDEESDVRIRFSLDEVNDVKDEAHPLFCQLSALQLFNTGNRSELQWREMSRWVKFEEDVEEGSNRWSRPFVPSLHLHFFEELRNLIEGGAVILDFHAINLPQIWNRVVELWVRDKFIEPDMAKTILATLFHRFSHQLCSGGIDSESSERARKNTLTDFLRSSSNSLLRKVQLSGTSTSIITLQDIFGVQDLHNIHAVESKPNFHFLKKLAPTTEAASVLVAELDFIKEPLSMFIRFTSPMVIANLTEVPVPSRYIYLLLTPPGSPTSVRQIGRAVGTLFSDEGFQTCLLEAATKSDILAGMDLFLRDATVLPPGGWNENIRIEPPTQLQCIQASVMVEGPGDIADSSETAPEVMVDDSGLIRTGKLFGALIGDVKRKMPFYLSDFRDGLNAQCIASFIFLYLASMTPLITFGGLMSDMLNGRMGAVETILARSFSGVIWALAAGQPVAILSCTGPNLVYESIVFYMCESIGVEYMSFRVWIGLWSMVELMMIVAFDLCSLVKYITRFTEESFAALVSVIFIYKAFKQLFNIYLQPTDEDPYLNDTLGVIYQNHTSFDDTDLSSGARDQVFYLSVLLFCGTYSLATVLKNLKNSSFFPTWMRSLISDFAIIISIVVFVGLDYLLNVATPKLAVPQELEPTFKMREKSWIVAPFGGNPWWTAIVAIIPGTLGTIMIFMDQSITTVIVNRKENQMKKGKGYHLDLIIVALLTGILSLLGMPWMIADTVLSLTHVNSLKMESQVVAPGQRPVFLGIREQRLTNILIALCVGASIFMTPILQVIPMPVLFGVFLFMGLNALNSLQFSDRVKLFFMPLKHQPDCAYLRHVRISRVHLFTLIQLAFFALLWVLKSFKETASLFPLMVGALVGVRRLLDKVFTQYELAFLDGVISDPLSKRRKDANLVDCVKGTQDDEKGGVVLLNVKETEQLWGNANSTNISTTPRWNRLDAFLPVTIKGLSPIPDGPDDELDKLTDRPSSPYVRME